MRQSIYRHLLLPLYENVVKRRKAFRHWAQLERTQWLSPVQLEKLQLESLRRLLTHAFEHCGYYRQSWLDQQLDPRRLASLADFQRWPVISRTTIQENRIRMRADNADTLLHKATGGSSGAPLQFDLDLSSYDWRVAAWHRGYAWGNAAPGTKQLYLWGVPLGDRSRWSRCKDRMYNALYRRRVLNSFELSEHSTPRFLATINRIRPDVIVAYTNPLYTFARLVEERGLKVVAPKSIIVGAEKLHDFQRDLIERVFGAPVFETYGCREFMLIGAECDRHEGLHLTAENLVVEVLDDDGRPAAEGEEGNVVVTDLHNYGMPFIRYANGDRAVAGWRACSCGRGLPLLQKVVGRQLDVIETPDGRRIPGEFFPHLVKDFPVRQFQVVQEATDLVKLRVVVGQGWSRRQQEGLEREIRLVLGEYVRLEVILVDEIPLTRSGKLRVVVNQSIRDSSRRDPAVAGVGTV